MPKTALPKAPTESGAAQAARQRFAALAQRERDDTRGYRVLNVEQAGNATKAKVYIYDVIDDWFGVSAASIVEAIDDLDVDEIELHINSPGGMVFEGLAIMNALRQHPATVTSYVDGLAASSASFIAVGAADEVVMGVGAKLFIHDGMNFAYGNAAALRLIADDLDMISDTIAAIYAAKTGGTAADWRARMITEEWFGAEQAIEAGLADRSTDTADLDAPAAAKNAAWDLSVLGARTDRQPPAPSLPAASAARANDQVAPAARSSQKGSAVAFTDEQLTTMRQELGLSGDADEQTILDALSEALAERADDAATTNTAPAGMVLMDEATVEQMRASAELGRQAHETQQTQARQAQVAAAIRDGRIAPSRREHWENSLAADPEGTAAILASLEPGLIPLTELGHDQDGPLATDQADKDYQALWGAPETQKQEA